MPPLEIHLFGYTAIPNPFFGGILFPGIVFTVLYAWPALERRITKDHARHDLLDRPRDNPWRTATGAAFFSWVAIIFTAGSADRILVSVGIPYVSQVWFFRIAAFIARSSSSPPCAASAAACARPRSIHYPSGPGRRSRNDAGGYDAVATSAPVPRQPPPP